MNGYQIRLWFESRGNAASSLRSTAENLATFLIELSAGQHLSPEWLAQMQTSYINVNTHVSWGLGIGLQHSEHGDCLWHWGSNPGSKSVMIIYPKQRVGVVVLSNSWNGSDLIQEVAARALGGKTYWDTGP
ncbi:MAG: serine hydrolase [bacterium]